MATKPSDRINFKEHLEQLQALLPTLGLRLGRQWGGIWPTWTPVSSAILCQATSAFRPALKAASPEDNCHKFQIKWKKEWAIKSQRKHKFTARKGYHEYGVISVCDHTWVFVLLLLKGIYYGQPATPRLTIAWPSTFELLTLSQHAGTSVLRPVAQEWIVSKPGLPGRICDLLAASLEQTRK